MGHSERWAIPEGRGGGLDVILTVTGSAGGGHWKVLVLWRTWGDGMGCQG